MTPAATSGPAFLRGLDHVTPADDGWIADCPICRQLLDITPGRLGHWNIQCDGECTHEDLVDYLHADTRLDQENTSALWRAVVLSPTLEVCQALLNGENVPHSALDPLWVKRFRL